MAYQEGDGTFRFVLTSKSDDLISVDFLYGDTAYPSPEVKMETLRMSLAYHGPDRDYFLVRFKTPYERLVYAFLLRCRSGETLYYYGESFHPGLSRERNDLFKFPFAFISNRVSVPSWVQKAVFYNVFPDSFIGRKAKPSKGKNLIYGGNLQALAESLDYIESLGCNAIYLNPIFKADSYHRYDTEDYLSLDPSFGREEEFRAFVEEVHRRKMHLIIDGVYNHSGPNFFAFRDVLKKQEKSIYKDWFYRLDFPIEYRAGERAKPRYATFGYEPHMPKLNLDNPDVRGYFVGVARKWIGEFGCDGFRMDTSDECSPGFWRFYKAELRKINPGAVMIAETWQNPRPMVMEQGFDGAMDYDFRRALIDFLVNDAPSSELAKRTGYLLYRIPVPNRNAMLSLLSTHDVPRFLSLLHEDKDKMALAYLIQFTYPGAVNLLYGDELGFTGLKEEEYRRPMEWGKKGVFVDLLSRLSSLRKSHPSLTEGDLHPVYSEDGGLYAYQRQSREERIVVAINRGTETRKLPFSAAGKPILANRYVDGQLGPMGYLLLLK